jgi:hypothetical protein
MRAPINTTLVQVNAVRRALAEGKLKIVGARELLFWRAVDELDDDRIPWLPRRWREAIDRIHHCIRPIRLGRGEAT